MGTTPQGKFFIPWAADVALDAVVAGIRDFLVGAGAEVDGARSGYRFLMFRKEARPWTQVMHGLTYRARRPRNRFVIVGPERDLLRPIEHNWKGKP